MRVSILRSFWRVHKCRHHILSRLEPFASRRRLLGYPPSAWEDAALTGFMVALITLLARRYAGSLDSDALASLQGTLWESLTGLPPTALGERVVALSAAADPRFLEGSRRALAFGAALSEAGTTVPPGPGPDAAGDASAWGQAGCRDALFDLWDSLLADLSPDGAAAPCQEFPDGH